MKLIKHSSNGDLDPVQMCSLKLGDPQGPIRGRKLSTATAAPQTCGPLMDPGSLKTSQRFCWCVSEPRADGSESEPGCPPGPAGSELHLEHRSEPNRFSVLIIDYLSVLLVLCQENICFCCRNSLKKHFYMKSKNIFSVFQQENIFK